MVLQTNSPCRACGRSAGGECCFLLFVGRDDSAAVSQDFALWGEFLSQRWERTQWPRPPALTPSGQFTLRIAGGRLRMSAPRSYSPVPIPSDLRPSPLDKGSRPPVPRYGGYPLGQAESFRRAKSEGASKFPPGHWTLAVLKFKRMRFHHRACPCRSGDNRSIVSRSNRS